MAGRSIATLALALLVLCGPAGAATTSGPPPAAPAGEAAARETHDVAFVDALTWGVTPSAMAAFRALGRAAWLKEQLHPVPTLPEAAQRQIDALAISHTSAFDRAVAFRARELAMQPVADPDEKAALQKAFQADMSDAARQAAAASILRALYGPDQLRGRMTWFWLNHFSVHQGKGNLRLLVGDYEDAAIRPPALGRFRDLLEATLRHPAMLRYLDNADNAASRINENYAREIMELHTLGVGSGYSQADVEALARILTGVGISTQGEAPRLKPEWQPLLVRDGLFEFNPARHDFSDKVFLGHAIKGRGFAEVEEALDILSHAPATARHVSRRIATYFVADDPPEALVARMAATFQASDGDIAAVLDTMIRAPEFEGALGTRFKDPVRYVYSAVRLAYDDKVITNTLPVQNWLNRLGEGLYGHQTPDGYPLASAAWTASGQMTTRFEIARQIGGNSAGLFKPADGEGAERPAFPLLQNSLYFSSLRLRLSAPTRLALEEATSPQDWNTLFLSSPEFMR
ncbi:DUF1800 domain-containing protein [Azorhizobium doebereinerae]|uniref:DUF1800 domain-containing protein n=1 Tax=Azorhizobium doebereinerae TaxID=281091 RepID=UPI00041DE06C|nr:DUF1800 domain-containing protein [Azorhizobium doebereinerae]